MTIAISIKVNDGIILATDSAATIMAALPDGKETGVLNVYNNADKLFNLCKNNPIGAITWGSGSIGQSSISTLVKDYRVLLSEKLRDQSNYTLEEVVKGFSEFIFEDNYIPAFKDWPKKPPIGFMVCGYSSNQAFPEEWKFEIINGNIIGPGIVRKPDEIGMTWNGESEAITRLYFGFSNLTPQVLSECGLDNNKIQEIMKNFQEKLMIPFIISAIPIKDAIDISQFFIETTMNFSKYRPGAPTVGGPIDIAAITKHEGFKWVKRKHYFNNEFNPSAIINITEKKED
ncbi:MAG: hypothetical protein AB9891_07805 [Anaerolineaceae bacterium]